MRNGLRGVLIAGAMAVGAVIVWLAGLPVAGQAPAAKAPRRATGKPNLNGMWQALGTANWDIQAHSAGPGPVPALGAVGAVPAGTSVVEGDEIPYQPWAMAKKKENYEKRWVEDPENKCFLP